MADEDYTSVYHDIEAAYNALLSLEGVDLDLHGTKGMKERITKNALKLIDKGLQYLVDSWGED